MPHTGKPPAHTREPNEGREGREAPTLRASAPNQIMLTLSYSLMNHVRSVARQEGVSAEDILVELVAEGVTKRVFEERQRPEPSHFMTRTGYVPPEANGNVRVQPMLSHHVHLGTHAAHGPHAAYGQSGQAGVPVARRQAPTRSTRPHAGAQANGPSPRRPPYDPEDE